MPPLNPNRLIRAAKAQVKQLGRKLWGGPPSKVLGPEHWGMSQGEQGLQWGNTPLAPLLDQYGSPLHVLSEQRLLNNFAGFTHAVGSRRLDVFLSYKTNPLPWLMQRLHQEGAGAEVISEYELWLALRLGVSPQRIIYNGPAKSDASLRESIERGILSININHAEELRHVQHMAAQLGRRARVSLRVTSAEGWTGQFGLPVESGAALQAYREALAMPNLEVVGVHCHRGVLMRSATDLARYLGFVLGFLDQLKQELNWSPGLLDLGGSLGVPTTRYLSEQERQRSIRYLAGLNAPDPGDTLTPSQYAQQVLEAVQAWEQRHGLAPMHLVIEPGRALTANTQLLLTRVVSMRAADGFDFAILDAGISIASIVASEYHAVLPLRPRPGVVRCHRLVGPICHMGDTLIYAQYLPPLQTSDAMAIMDSGAYFMTDASSFSNGQPGAVVIRGQGEPSWIRAPQGHEQMVALDRF